jgi:hypothetical protein
MTDSEILRRVRVVLEQEQGRVCRELTAALLADLDGLLDEVESLLARAERVAALRASKGRALSVSSQERLGELHAALGDLAALVRTGARQ